MLSPVNYNKELNEIKKRKEKITKGFRYDAVGNDELRKISLPGEDNLNLFTEDIYNEFKRYLQPPFHVLTQGIKINYTGQQETIIKSSNKRQKVKGIAGSGKTIVLAKIAVSEYKKNEERVLILTYNITLRNYIRDHISDVRENFSWNGFYIDNYHDFFKQNANNLEISMSVSSETKHKEQLFSTKMLNNYMEKTFYANINFFKNHYDKTTRYDTILIDEIQDYEPEWVKIVEKYFLKENGKMILFGDEKQNIYNLDLNSEKQTKTIKGFGRWVTLTKPARQLSGGDRILNLSKKFQQAFFKNKYELDNYTNYIQQLRANEGIFTTICHKTEIQAINDKLLPFQEAKNIARVIFKAIQSNNIHPNDIVILSPKIAIIRAIDFFLRTHFKVNTITTFETQEMFDSLIGTERKNDILYIRKTKKLFFNANSGKIKLSTIHSFKGYEAKTVFLVLGNEEHLLQNDASDYVEKYHEIVYAGITRSKSNLMILINKNDRFYEFFSVLLGKHESIEKEKTILEIINDSINNQISINIKYKQHNEILDKKDIKPYKILFMNDNYYVACEVNSKYKFSMFRLSSIKNIISTNDKFNLNIDIQDFVANIQTPFSTYRENYREHLIEVILEVDKLKAHIFESKLFLPSQKKLSSRENGNLVLSFQVTQEREIEDLIKKWLPYLKVIEPISLDEKIKTDIKQYLNS